MHYFYEFMKGGVNMNVVYINSLVDKHSVDIFLYTLGIAGPMCATTPETLNQAILSATSSVNLYVFDYSSDSETIEAIDILRTCLSSVKVFCKRIETAKRYLSITSDVYVMPDAFDIMVLFWTHPMFKIENIVDTVPTVSKMELSQVLLDGISLNISAIQNDKPSLEIREQFNLSEIPRDNLVPQTPTVDKFKGGSSRRSLNSIDMSRVINQSVSFTVPQYIVAELGKTQISVDVWKREFAVNGHKEGYSTFEEYLYKTNKINLEEYCNILTNFFDYKILKKSEMDTRKIISECETYYELERLDGEPEKVYLCNVNDLKTINDLTLKNRGALIIRLVED